MTAQPIIVQGDALRLPLPDGLVDAIVCDPPYGLEFMGKDWDKLDGGLPQENVWKGRHGQGGASVGNDDTRPGSRHHVAYGGKPSGFRRCQLCGRRQFSGSPCTCPEPEWVIEYAQRAPSSAIRMQRWHETWAREAYRVLKPGGWLLAFGGTRTWHRLACGIEDAGFEMRDTIAEFGPSYGPLALMYGSGFPKSRNVSKDLDGVRCQCSAVPYDHGAQPEAEYDLSCLPSGDVSAPLPARAGEGPLLFSELPEQGTPETWPQARYGDEDGAESGLEGRGDLLQDSRELHGSPLPPGASVGETDGQSGRLHHGASAGHGGMGGPAADQDGSGQPPRPQAGEQRPEQSGVVADERRSQARGGWPLCSRCSKPVVPSGLGTALKPSWEPVIVARKPLSGTVAQNVLTYGTGALNIDASRIDHGGDIEQHNTPSRSGLGKNGIYGASSREQGANSPTRYHATGRWPPNVALVHSAGCQPTGTRKIRSQAPIYRRDAADAAPDDGLIYGKMPPRRADEQIGYADADGMEEVTAWACEPDCPVALLDQQSGDVRASGHRNRSEQAGEPTTAAMGYMKSFAVPGVNTYADHGGASRFMYTAKAGPNERVTIDGEGHPCVKPLALMRWLVRLVTPPGGLVLDPFAGSGTTGEAAMLEGFRSILIDKDPTNLPSIRLRTHPYVRRTKIITNGSQTIPEQGTLL